MNKLLLITFLASLHIGSACATSSPAQTNLDKSIADLREQLDIWNFCVAQYDSEITRYERKKQYLFRRAPLQFQEEHQQLSALQAEAQRSKKSDERTALAAKKELYRMYTEKEKQLQQQLAEIEAARKGLGIVEQSE